MKRIAIAASVGWAAILGLAWYLANARIRLCEYGATNCIVRTTAARDSTLVYGLSIGLIVGVMTAILVMAGSRARAPDAPNDAPTARTKNQPTALLQVRRHSSPMEHGGRVWWIVGGCAGALFALSAALIVMGRPTAVVQQGVDRAQEDTQAAAMDDYTDDASRASWRDAPLVQGEPADGEPIDQNGE